MTSKVARSCNWRVVRGRGAGIYQGTRRGRLFWEKAGGLGRVPGGDKTGAPGGFDKSNQIRRDTAQNRTLPRTEGDGKFYRGTDKDRQ